MNENLGFSLLGAINDVYLSSKDSSLSEEYFNLLDLSLSDLKEYFQLNTKEIVIISVMFALNFKTRSVEINDVAKHFDVSPLQVLEFTPEINKLISMGYIICIKTNSPYKGLNQSIKYFISSELIDSVLENKVLSKNKTTQFSDLMQLLEVVGELADLRENNEITTVDLFERTRDLLTVNHHFFICQKIKQLKINVRDACFLLLIIWKTTIGYDNISISFLIDRLLEREINRVKFLQELIKGDLSLIKANLIKIHETDFINNTLVQITSATCQVLKKDGLKLFSDKKKFANSIQPSKIARKVLFYNDEEGKQIELIKNMLVENNLKSLTERLAKKRLPKGITVLLHGASGTGKTETVYQLAKLTGREIMKVEISKSKSMWYGESEKLIKKIFTEYYDFKTACKKTPILLFNEADAIISKRRNVNESNIARTENTIQNIILEELESFEGLFFATTNLVKNIDSAFERRFLFKVEFSLPDLNNRAKIWKSKLKSLSLDESILLANKYPFSGGEIDNITRKTEMMYIINGKKAGINDIQNLCEEEKLIKTIPNSIGFKQLNR